MKTHHVLCLSCLVGEEVLWGNSTKSRAGTRPSWSVTLDTLKTSSSQHNNEEASTLTKLLERDRSHWLLIPKLLLLRTCSQPIQTLSALGYNFVQWKHNSITRSYIYIWKHSSYRTLTNVTDTTDRRQTDKRRHIASSSRSRKMTSRSNFRTQKRTTSVWNFSLLTKVAIIS